MGAGVSAAQCVNVAMACDMLIVASLTLPHRMRIRGESHPHAWPSTSRICDIGRSCPTNPPSPPAFPGTRTPPATPRISGARRRPPCRRRHHRRRLHRPVGGRPSRQGGHRRRADRGASLRRRRVGPQWRPARHRPARLGRGARGRDRLDARQGAVRSCRGGQGASARIRRGQRHRHRLHARPDVGRAQEALCRRLPQNMPTIMRERASAIRTSPSWTPTETAERLGSTHYFGGTRDTGTGHIHPLKLVVGTARVAAEAGAQLFENTKATGITTDRRQGAGDDADRHDHRRQGPDRRQRLWRRPRAGRAPRTSCRSARSSARPCRSAPTARCCRAARRSTIRASSCAISASRSDGRLLFGGREIYARQGSEGHPHPYPPADRRDLSGAEGRRDHPWLGRLSSASRCRASRSCAR